MEGIKRSHFEAAHPGVSFPDVETLNFERVGQLRRRIAERLRCPADDGLTIVRTLLGRSTLVEGVNAQSPDFELLQALWTLQLRPRESVYLNWHRFDSIDRIRLRDLAEFFADIWYPSSDDLDVFDDTTDWILSIGHSGDIRIARLGVRDVAARSKLRKSK